jgi:TRAP-type C4-dicarboxylate transport system permease small subunit
MANPTEPAVDAPASPAATDALARPPALTPFPEDGAFSASLRRIDHALGLGEQSVLFAILALVVIVATVQAISAHAFGHQIEWAFQVIRDGVFAIALLGAAFASHQQRHLSMDLVSRRLAPRPRLYLRVFLGVITLAMAILLVRAGLHLTRSETRSSSSGLAWILDPRTGFLEWLTTRMIAVGSALISIHTLIHLLIDCDYLARRRLPPERVRSGH